jgi:hypothetical protein
MRRTIIFAAALAAFAQVSVSGANAAPAKTAGGGLDTAMIESATGAKGTLDEKEGVFKVTLPRTDIKQTVAGARITPPLGLACWAAFTKAGKHAMVMGDIVLLENQVSMVMEEALDAGLEVTALHNHFVYDSPRVMFMHVGGMGDEKTLATAIGRVFKRVLSTEGEGNGETFRSTADPAKTTLDPAAIEAVLGYKGEMKDGVYKVVIGRTTKMGGHTVGKAMGINTWAAFSGSELMAFVDGDFCVLPSELQPVLKALRKGQIDVVAIHNHMTDDNPRLVFLHFMSLGSTTDLAKTIKAALDLTKHTPPPSPSSPPPPAK